MSDEAEYRNMCGVPFCERKAKHTVKIEKTIHPICNKHYELYIQSIDEEVE